MPSLVTSIDAAAGDAAVDAPAIDAPMCASTTATRCGARCVELSTDAQHCGACDHACAATEACAAGACTACPTGHCPPANDDCANATLVAVPSYSTHLAQDASGATAGLPSCLTGGPEVFFAVDTTQRSLLAGWVDSGEPSGWFANCGDTAITCGPTASPAFYVAPGAGRWFFAGGIATLGQIDLDFDVQPIGANTVVIPMNLTTGTSVSATAHLSAGTSGTDTCGSTAADLLFYGTCQDGLVHVTCHGPLDATVAVRTRMGTNCAVATCGGTPSAITSVDQFAPLLVFVSGPTSGDVTLTIGP
jgi:hypothetical protein